MSETSHSEYGTIKSIFLKRVKDSFIDDQKIEQQWEKLNYLSKPDLSAAEVEYQEFEDIIRNFSENVILFEPDHNLSLDSLYCRDASIATDFGMIICNMGKDGRVLEPNASKKAFLDQEFGILGIIQSPGTIEGGDVAWLNSKTLAVGHTYRTNKEGITQLRELLEPNGIKVVVANLPHYKGVSDVFHLMSILSPVDKDLAVVFSPLMPIDFRNNLLEIGFQLIEVPEEEFDSMGCNVLALGPRKCLMVAGNPVTKERLISSGCEVIEYNGNEISVKGGGGPTCLTRPVKRTVNNE